MELRVSECTKSTLMSSEPLNPWIFPHDHKSTQNDKITESVPSLNWRLLRQSRPTTPPSLRRHPLDWAAASAATAPPAAAALPVGCKHPLTLQTPRSALPFPAQSTAAVVECAGREAVLHLLPSSGSVEVPLRNRAQRRSSEQEVVHHLLLLHRGQAVVRHRVRPPSGWEAAEQTLARSAM